MTHARTANRLHIRPSTSSTLLMIAILAPAVFGQASAPLGEEFQVNVATPRLQLSPSIAADPAGNFFVVWEHRISPPAGSETSIVQGRRFAADGTALAEEFPIDADASGQFQPVIASDGAGNFVVVWNGPDELQSRTLLGRRFPASGQAPEAVFQISSSSSSGQTYPQVAASSEGRFIVAWTSFQAEGTDSSFSSIQARRFDADGSALGDDFQVNTYTTGSQDSTSAAMHPDGGAVVVWRSAGSNGNDNLGTSIQGRRFAPDGNPLGDESQINTYTPDNQFLPEVAALTDGGFVVTWRTDGANGDPSDESIQARRFDSSGNPAGNQFQVNSIDERDQSFPEVTGLADGGFLIVWESLFLDPKNATTGKVDTTKVSGTRDLFYDVQGQVYGADGEPRGQEFKINSLTPDDQMSAVAAPLGEGFVVAWSSYGSNGTDDDQTSIQARRFGRTSCAPAANRLCLNRSRFAVEVEWTDFAGTTGSGQAVPVSSDDSGLFWFFGPDNWEMLVKVLDGCGINGHFWVFAAATTDVEVTLRVTDTEAAGTGNTGTREYFNPLGTAAAAITDTEAFATCP